MFLVRQQGKTLESFDSFIDAWVYCVLNLKSYSLILQGQDQWVINPPSAN